MIDAAVDHRVDERSLRSPCQSGAPNLNEECLVEIEHSLPAFRVKIDALYVHDMLLADRLYDKLEENSVVIVSVVGFLAAVIANYSSRSSIRTSQGNVVCCVPCSTRR